MRTIIRDPRDTLFRRIRENPPAHRLRLRPAGVGSALGRRLLLLAEMATWDGHLDQSAALLRPDGVQGSCIFIQTERLLFTHQTCMSGEVSLRPRLLEAGRARAGGDRGACGGLGVAQGTRGLLGACGSYQARRSQCRPRASSGTSSRGTAGGWGIM